ncbi:hypothetical protein D9M71_288220 [compost metagenome]
MAASKPSSSTIQRHFSSLPAMPTTRQPFSLAICPAMEPQAPAAALISAVSPGRGWPISSRPKYGVRPTALKMLM